MHIIFEAHATTIDNEAKVSSGWRDVDLSAAGQLQAKELGVRYAQAKIDAVFCSDLQRSFKTAQFAFSNIDSKRLFLDWRLRECNYGDKTMHPSEEVDKEKFSRITDPFPNGESYTQALERMKSFLDDLKKLNLEEVMIIGHRATQYGLEHWINGKEVSDLVTGRFVWQPGWHYQLTK